MWIGLGVVAVAILGVVGFLVVRGGDDDDSTDRDRDRTEERDDRGDDEGNPDDAVDVAQDLVQALIDGDCDRAADLATDDFIDDELDSACSDTPEGAEIHDAQLDNEDPVVVVVTVESDDGGDDGISELPLEMAYEDGDWLVQGVYFDEPDIDSPTASTIEVPGTSFDPDESLPDDGSLPTASDDPEVTAEQAIQAVIDGDCATALSLGTLDFIGAHSEELCSGELLPPDAVITGVETIGDDPVVVSVDVEAGGDSFGIELTFAEEFGQLLIDDYSV
jgi:hypothetical protein